MEPQKVEMIPDGPKTGAAPTVKQLATVGTWSSFSKLPEEEKAKLFNAMRGACIVAGLMENK